MSDLHGPKLRSILPSLRDRGAYLDGEIAFWKHRRAVEPLVRELSLSRAGYDPVRHPEGREDPTEYA